MTDPTLDAAARARDLPAAVDAVAERIAMPAEPSGPLAACARALVDRHLADAETAPTVARVVAEALLQAAKTCLACGEIHTARYSARPGETAHLTWAHPVDGHSYRPTTQMVIYWLDRVLQEGA